MFSDELRIIFTIVVLGSFVFILNRAAYRKVRNGEWHHHSPTEMRRYVKGAWQKRPATEKEMLESAERDAW